MNLQDVPPWLMNVGGFAALLFFLRRWVSEIDGKLDKVLAQSQAHDTRMAVMESRLARVEIDCGSLHNRVSKLISAKLDEGGNAA